MNGARLRPCVIGLLFLATPVSSAAQGVDGYVSLMGNLLPDVRLDVDEQRAVSELRARLFVERRFEVGRFRLTTAGFVDGLLAGRQRGRLTHAAIARPQEFHVEALWAKGDLRVGLSRVVWGRLDEFLPTDVVNPQDLTRFFLEGRSEGRMPVAMIRGRILPSDRFTVELIYVPVFRRGRFDQLDEDTSPFNVSPQSSDVAREFPGLSDAQPGGVEGSPATIKRISQQPAHTFANAQGGARVSVTTGRVDWSVSTFRGFETLPIYQVDDVDLPFTPGASVLPVVRELFPRYTMVGGDFETVRGSWGIRGEVAAFIDRMLQAVDAPVTPRGNAVEAGVGVDRKTGAYRVSSSAVVTNRRAHSSVVEPGARGPSVVDGSLADVAIDRTDLTLVGMVDRSFARETRNLRIFAVYNPGEDSAFARAIFTFTLRDNLSLEASAGWFTGDGVDVLSRLATRDFVYARLKVFF